MVMSLAKWMLFYVLCFKLLLLWCHLGNKFREFRFCTCINHVLQFWNAISDRILTACFRHKRGHLTVIVAYAPTEASSTEDKDVFYSQLSSLTQAVPNPQNWRDWCKYKTKTLEACYSRLAAASSRPSKTLTSVWFYTRSVHGWCNPGITTAGRNTPWVRQTTAHCFYWH